VHDNYTYLEDHLLLIVTGFSSDFKVSRANSGRYYFTQHYRARILAPCSICPQLLFAVNRSDGLAYISWRVELLIRQLLQRCANLLVSSVLPSIYLK